MLEGKTIIVTGAASGIGAETAMELQRRGASVIGVDRNPVDGVDQSHQVDLTDPSAIADLVEALPSGINGLCNIAGLPADRTGIDRYHRERLRASPTQRTDGAEDGRGWLDHPSRFSRWHRLAGRRWRGEGTLALDFGDDIGPFCESHKLDEGGRSYFLSKECVQIYTMMNRWTWRDRGIRMNCISPGPVDTPILPDFSRPSANGQKRHEDHGSPRSPNRYCTGGRVSPERRLSLVPRCQPDLRRWHMSSHINMHMHGVEG